MYIYISYHQFHALVPIGNIEVFYLDVIRSICSRGIQFAVLSIALLTSTSIVFIAVDTAQTKMWFGSE